MSWKSAKVKMTENRVTIRMIGRSSGKVMKRNRSHPPAPSMEAASYSSEGTVCRPASRVIP